MQLRRLRIICVDSLVFVLLSSVSATCAPSAQKKNTQQATPSEGNKSDQTFDVVTPFCDSYLPYRVAIVEHTQTVTQEFPTLPLPVTADDLKKFLADINVNAFLSSFIQNGWTVSDPVKKDRSFVDPGYPILGNPNMHLYADGSDLGRLLFRLFAFASAGNQTPQPLCLAHPTQPASPQSEDADPNIQYYLVHVVRWKRSHGAYISNSSDWYLFNKSDSKVAHRQFPFIRFHPSVGGNLRLFGSNQVYFLAIHLAPSGDYSDFAQKVRVAYKFQVKDLVPANVQDLQAFIGVVGGAPSGSTGGEEASKPKVAQYKAFLTASLGRTYAGIYGAARLTNLEKLPVQITANMEASLPQTDAKLLNEEPYGELGFWNSIGTKTDLQADPAPTAAKDSPSQDPAAGNNTQSNPSNRAPIASKSISQSTNSSGSSNGCSTVKGGTCSENVVIQDEGLYHWDVSVGIPFSGIKQLQYNYASNGQVTPQTISKSSAYGFVVIAPWKEDILNPPSLGIPHLMAGLPFTGSVFNAPFLGIGETFNLSKIPAVGTTIGKAIPLSVRFYVGAVDFKQFGAVTPSSPISTSQRVWKLQYGIEFSVREIASKLTGKSSNSNQQKNASSSKTANKSK
jgi:hypothetical protein